MAVQLASATPQNMARPGTPISRYALMSEASVLIAVTTGPSLRPPRKNSSLLLFFEYAKPITSMPIR